MSGFTQDLEKLARNAVLFRRVSQRTRCLKEQGCFSHDPQSCIAQLSNRLISLAFLLLSSQWTHHWFTDIIHQLLEPDLRRRSTYIISCCSIQSCVSRTFVVLDGRNILRRFRLPRIPLTPHYHHAESQTLHDRRRQRSEPCADLAKAVSSLDREWCPQNCEERPNRPPFVPGPPWHRSCDRITYTTIPTCVV